MYIALYLLPGLGTSGVNAGRLASLTSLIKGLKVPWLIAADWNQSPGSLREVLELWNAVVLLPDGNDEPTCLQGKGTCIDYVVCPAALANKVTVEKDMDDPGTPWSPHLGLKILINKIMYDVTFQTIYRPKPIDCGYGPRRWTWEQSPTVRQLA